MVGSEPTSTPLDLLLVNREGLVGDVKVGGHPELISKMIMN